VERPQCDLKSLEQGPPTTVLLGKRSKMGLESYDDPIVKRIIRLHCDAGVVSDHHQRLPRAIELFKERENFCSCSAV
jgi:hypothetical protein